MKSAFPISLPCLIFLCAASLDPFFQPSSWATVSAQLDPDVAEAIEELRNSGCVDCYQTDTWCGYLDPGPLDQHAEQMNKIEAWWAEDLVRWRESHGDEVAMEKDQYMQQRLKRLAALPEMFHRCILSIGHTRIEPVVR